MAIPYRATGFSEKIDNFEDKMPDYDPRTGDHFWFVAATYKVDPQIYLRGESHLDHESLTSVLGPGCYYCEQYYTPQLATRRCKGKP